MSQAYSYQKRCRVCGWPIVPEDNPGPGCWVTNCSLRPPPDRRADEPAYYSTDRNAAALALERIGKLGLHRQFNENLARQIWPEDRPFSTFGGADVFAFEKLTATPRQLCEAALACVEKEPKSNG